MIIPNARITAWARATGALGDGRPALQALALRGAAGVPCQVADPSFRLRATLEAQDIEPTRVVHVSLARLRFHAVGAPTVGDRLTLVLETPSGDAAAEQLAVGFVMGGAGRRPGAIDIVTLALIAAADGAVIAPAEEEGE